MNINSENLKKNFKNKNNLYKKRKCFLIKMSKYISEQAMRLKVTVEDRYCDTYVKA